MIAGLPIRLDVALLQACQVVWPEEEIIGYSYLSDPTRSALEMEWRTAKADTRVRYVDGIWIRDKTFFPGLDQAINKTLTRYLTKDSK